MELVEMRLEDCVLPRRARDAHKGDFGRVLILAGSEGYTGAAVFSARAAVRGGAGLVFLAVPRGIYPIVAEKCDEAMAFPYACEEDVLKRVPGCDAVLVGPGLGRGALARRLLLRLMDSVRVPLVVDADGINLLSEHIDILERRSAPTVLTPHEGEFQRLSGCSLPIPDRKSAAKTFVRRHGGILVLKGMETLTVSRNCLCRNHTGNPGMAKGGSGDVLAGLLCALLGQRQMSAYSLERRCAMAVCLHGAAGDLCARELGEYGMTPSDLLLALPRVMKERESAQE